MHRTRAHHLELGQGDLPYCPSWPGLSRPPRLWRHSACLIEMAGTIGERSDAVLRTAMPGHDAGARRNRETSVEKLSQLIKGPDLIVAPCALNPIMAQMAALAGFKAAYLSGGSLGWYKGG